MSKPTTDWARLMGDPLLTKFLNRAQKDLGQKYGAPQITTPDQVIGEQRAMALVAHRTDERLADDLIAAVPFLWINDLDPYIRSFALPRHTVASDLVPYDRCWWTFQGGHPMDDVEAGVRVGLADGFLIVKHGNVFTIGVMGQSWPVSPEAPGGLIYAAKFAAGQVWPDDIASDKRPLVGEVLARLAFLRAPFVESVVERPNPKHHGKLRPRSSPEGVRFIRLRSSLAETHRSESQSLVEWHHRWLVRGHLRAQWYPKAREHRLIWVSPYAKGPEDKPFKSPVYAVVR